MARPARAMPRIPVTLNLDPLDPRDRAILETSLEIARSMQVFKDGQPSLRFGIEELLREAVAARQVRGLGGQPLLPGGFVTPPPATPENAESTGNSLEQLISQERERTERLRSRRSGSRARKDEPALPADLPEPAQEAARPLEASPPPAPAADAPVSAPQYPAPEVHDAFGFEGGPAPTPAPTPAPAQAAPSPTVAPTSSGAGWPTSSRDEHVWGDDLLDTTRSPRAKPSGVALLGLGYNSNS